MVTTLQSIYLVNAGNDPGISSIANDSSFPALSVLALGTAMQIAFPEMQVTARDGQVVPMESSDGVLGILDEIKKERPAVVGISTLCTSYGNALKIAQAAKDVGAITVLGNDHARDLSHRVLEHRPYVDFVIGHEYGESPLISLVSELQKTNPCFDTIPSLTHRTAKGRVVGFDYSDAVHRKLLSITSEKGGYGLPRLGGLDKFPLINWNLFPEESHWNKYRENYLSRFSHLHAEEIGSVTTMNRARGCSRAKDPCTYCDLNLDLSSSSAEKFWEEIRNAHEKIDATVFYEVCDSFSSFATTLIPELAEKKPKDLGFNPQLFVYGQAADFVRNKGLAQQLRKIGVFRINIGLDSMSDPTLQYMKGTSWGDSVETNMAALRLAKEAGLHVYSSFVLGSQAETPDTLSETVQNVKRIIEQGLVADVEAQPLMPLYGNKEGQVMEERGLWEQVRKSQHTPDWPVAFDKVAKVYVNNCSKITYEQAVQAAAEIRDFARQAGINYGSGLSHTRIYEAT